MLNLFGCSNWDFFIHFFELKLRTNSKTNTVTSLQFSVDLFAVGQRAKESKTVNF